MSGDYEVLPDRGSSFTDRDVFSSGSGSHLKMRAVTQDIDDKDPLDDSHHYAVPVQGYGSINSHDSHRHSLQPYDCVRGSISSFNLVYLVSTLVHSFL